MAAYDKSNTTTSASLASDNHTLQITVATAEGKQSTALLDLDSVIGVVNGALSFGADGGFSSVARSVSLESDGGTLDAQIPDVNGDYSTSSLFIEHLYDQYEGNGHILLAINAPHSAAHVDADSIDAANDQVQSSLQVSGAHPSSETGSPASKRSLCPTSTT